MPLSAFTLSYRDVEEMLAERGLDLTYETVRRWVTKFGPLFARELRKRRPRPTSRSTECSNYLVNAGYAQT
jgi:putative transposase